MSETADRTCASCGADLTELDRPSVARRDFECTNGHAGTIAANGHEQGPAFEVLGTHRMMTDGGEDVATISRDAAETLLEAAGTLRDDIASGRQWGYDTDESRQNASDLEDAHAELQDELRTPRADNNRGDPA